MVDAPLLSADMQIGKWQLAQLPQTVSRLLGQLMNTCMQSCIMLLAPHQSSPVVGIYVSCTAVQGARTQREHASRT